MMTIRDVHCICTSRCSKRTICQFCTGVPRKASETILPRQFHLEQHTTPIYGPLSFWLVRPARPAIYTVAGMCWNYDHLSSRNPYQSVCQGIAKEWRAAHLMIVAVLAATRFHIFAYRYVARNLHCATRTTVSKSHESPEAEQTKGESDETMFLRTMSSDNHCRKVNKSRFFTVAHVHP